MNSYSTEDAVADLLRAPGGNDEDIPVIQRDLEPVMDYPYGYKPSTNASGHSNGTVGDHHHEYTQVPNAGQASTSSSSHPHSHIQSNPIDDYQLVPQGKYMSTYPPLQGLSESVLPPSLSIQAAMKGSLNGGSNNNNADINNSSSNNGKHSQSEFNNNNDNDTNDSTGAGNALKKRKEATGPKTRPAFVMKIWSMVNDPANKQYIAWNEDGKSFHVFHREEFMKLILPKYFKHNNFASFVRQLNMYGWHKVQDVNNGSLYSQGKETDNGGGADEILQFENPYFVRGREDLLDKIQRNKNSGTNDAVVVQDPNAANFSLILNELDQIKLNQLALSEDLRRVRKDNKNLWHENYIARERHQQQAQTLEKILSFLATVYGNSGGKISEVENSPFDIHGVLAPYRQQQQQNHQNLQHQLQHQQQQQPQQLYESSSQPNNYESNPFDIPPPSPFNKPRLMLMNKAYQSSPDSNRNGSTSEGGVDSVEEIMRSYENTPKNNNFNDNNAPPANRVYQHLINQDHPSPRHFFPELNGLKNGNNYFERPGTPQPIQNSSSLANQNVANSPGNNDAMNVLEQNIYKQGQSIQQVQDWILKLAAQQQEIQQNNNNLSKALQFTPSQHILQSPSLPPDFHEQNFDINKPDFDEFDVNDFLDSGNSGLPPTPILQDHNTYGRKRTIEEVHDDEEDSTSKK